MRDEDNVEAGEGVFPMTWDVDGVGGRLSGIAAEEETSLASLHRLSRSMPNLAELRQLCDRIYEVRFQSIRLRREKRYPLSVPRQRALI